jgi:hypothetical protein
MKKLSMVVAFVLLFTMYVFAGCTTPGNQQDAQKNLEVGSKLALAQPIPTDVDYSLERYNLIRRMYWVNGQREKATNLPCPIADVPLGYIILFTDSGAVVGRFVVEGKVSSLTNYLTPLSEYYSRESYLNEWIPDTDGTYGDNPAGVFFFTPDKKYMEWTGIYLYSDTLFEISDPIIRVGG